MGSLNGNNHNFSNKIRIASAERNFFFERSIDDDYHLKNA